MKRQPIGRYYTKRERRRRYFKASDGYLKENAEECEEEEGPFTDVFFGLLPDECFLARAERLSAWAGAFLRARGLPDCYWVSFPPERPEEWEECEPLEDGKPLEALLHPSRNLRQLDYYLREYRGVQDDEAEDLAARIVCTVCALQRTGDNDLAMHFAYDSVSLLCSLISTRRKTANAKSAVNRRVPCGTN